jgi:hypothetical protein
MTHTETVTETTHTAVEVGSGSFRGPLGTTHRAYHLEPPLDDGSKFVAVVSATVLQTPVSVYTVGASDDVAQGRLLAKLPCRTSDADALSQLGYRLVT